MQRVFFLNSIYTIFHQIYHFPALASAKLFHLSYFKLPCDGSERKSFGKFYLKKKLREDFFNAFKFFNTFSFIPSNFYFFVDSEFQKISTSNRNNFVVFLWQREIFYIFERFFRENHKILTLQMQLVLLQRHLTIDIFRGG